MALAAAMMRAMSVVLMVIDWRATCPSCTERMLPLRPSTSS